MTTSMVNIALEGARMNALLASVIELDLCDAVAWERPDSIVPGELPV